MFALVSNFVEISGVSVQRFHEHVLPNIQQLVSADHVRSVHESGADLRTHLINARKYLHQNFDFMFINAVLAHFASTTSSD